MNSNRKGKNGERELASVLREYGFDARRGVQYHGGSESPDVIGIDGVHIECKRCEQFRIYDWIRQSIRDAGTDVPTVMFRKNNEEWLVTMRLSDFVEVYLGQKKQN